MVKVKKLSIDLDFLKSIYLLDPTLLDEMALPSYFHKNPLVRWITSTRIKKALRFVEPKTGIHLLDFGCGSGILLLQLPQETCKSYGVDIELWPAEKMLKHHDREDIQLIHADHWAEAIPNNSLDYILATEVLEHIEDVSSILITFNAKNKIGGKLIVSLPTENSLYKLGRKIAGFSGHYHQDQIVEINEACIQNGYVLEKSYAIPAPGLFCLYKLYLFTKVRNV